MTTGYLHPRYVSSLSELGTPVQLPASQGFVLRRAIFDTPHCDAVGPYPLFSCLNWEGLRHDLADLERMLVSIVLVADPFGGYDFDLLERTFSHVIPFKEHHVVRTGPRPDSFVSAGHRRNALRALRHVDVSVCPDPLALLDDWERLYGVLVGRHAITGLRRFSREVFRAQLAVPGLVMFRAGVGQRTVGLDLWYVQGDCAYGHLAAFDPEGYELHASYATKWRMLEYFHDKVKWVDLGGGATGDPDDGLAKFKRGWATSTRTAWLCGRVLQPANYASLTARIPAESSEAYFPAYRRGERF